MTLNLLPVSSPGHKAKAPDKEAAKWLVGTWAGASPSPAGEGKIDQREIVFKEDGTYKSEIQSARGGLLYVVGTWKANGDEITLDGLYQGGGAAVHGQRAHVVYRRTRADQLEAETVSPLDGKRVSISIKRVK